MRRKHNLKDLSVDELKSLSSDLIELTEKELLTIMRMISLKTNRRMINIKNINTVFINVCKLAKTQKTPKNYTY